MSDTTTLLAQLRDVQQPLPPEGVSLWLIAANISIAGLIVALLWYQKRQSISGWRKQFIKDLRQAKQQPPTEAIGIAATQLRQLMLFHGHKIQNLSGDTWLQELDRQFNTLWFTQGDGQVFGDALYQRGAVEKQKITSVFKELETLVKSLPSVQKNKAELT